MSDQAVLRPVTEDDLDLLDRFLLEPETIGPYEWLGWIEPDRWRRQWAENGLLGDDGGKLMVVVEGEPVGFVGWDKIATLDASYCWNIGIGLLPEARGQGHGTEAHRLLVDHLFAHTDLHRIEAATAADNLAERRALEKAGFTQEEILHSNYFRDGQWYDSYVYSLIRGEGAQSSP